MIAKGLKSQRAARRPVDTMTRMATTLTDEHRAPRTIPLHSFGGKNAYFIGIGGCGMSGLARLVRGIGAECSGSDNVPSEVTDTLRADGLVVHHDQRSSHIPDDCDLVIATAAIPDDHPELVDARTRRLPILGYAEALGLLQASRTTISIAGTHGKSTTTAILAHILIEAGLDPSVLLGATCPQIGGGSRVGADRVPGSGPLAGRDGLLVAEACEFNRSFHHHRPTLALINNVEPDHLDVYGSLDGVIEAFAGFARHLPAREQGGRLLIAHEGAFRKHVAAQLECGVETFGLEHDATYPVQYDASSGRTALHHGQTELAHWRMPMPGRHSALNTAAAAILAHWCGVAWHDAARAITKFSGIDRRMQRLGHRAVAGGAVTVYDDYAHHPTEIRATLRALRECEQPARIVCVFQPHQHSRTRLLLDEFAESFGDSDLVIVPDIYFVRDPEPEKARINSGVLVDRMREQGVQAFHIPSFEAVIEQLDTMCRDGDLLVIMGAGPVWKIARSFMAGGVNCDSVRSPHS